MDIGLHGRRIRPMKKRASKGGPGRRTGGWTGGRRVDRLTSGRRADRRRIYRLAGSLTDREGLIARKQLTARK
jgi:hypothetical protein